MGKKRKILNNKQLTSVADNHEIRITKLETKKKKPPQNDNKKPRITIADVMQTLVEFQTSVDQRFNKLESSVDERFNKLETSVEKRFNKIEQRLNNLNDRVGKIENEVFKKQIRN